MVIANPPMWLTCKIERKSGSINSFSPSSHSEPWFIVSDPRVMYSEPAKFVAKLRDLKTDDNLLLFKCEFGAGHSSKSGR
jgi:hypothetical protein